MSDQVERSLVSRCPRPSGTIKARSTIGGWYGLLWPLSVLQAISIMFSAAPKVTIYGSVRNDIINFIGQPADSGSVEIMAGQLCPAIQQYHQIEDILVAINLVTANHT